MGIQTQTFPFRMRHAVPINVSDVASNAVKCSDFIV